LCTNYIYNSAGAYGKCDRDKWHKLSNIDKFKTILKRNEKHSELFKKDHDEEHIKEFERFEKITKAKS